MEKRRTLQRQRTMYHSALESAVQREERLSRHRYLEQQRARDRHAAESVEEKEERLLVKASWRSTKRDRTATEAQREGRLVH